MAPYGHIVPPRSSFWTSPPVSSWKKNPRFFRPAGSSVSRSRNAFDICRGRFTFTSKELDAETGYSYFGARYYAPATLTAWLSVDPMADKYPSISPYAYCAWNPLKLVDPEGRETIECDDGWNTRIDNNTGQKTLVRVNNDGGDMFQSFEDYSGPSQICSTSDFVDQYASMGYSVSDETGGGNLSLSTCPEKETKTKDIFSTIGAVDGALASLTFSKSRGKWLGKNGKFYSRSFNGNGTTGGKLKFAKNTSKYLKGAGSVFSLLSLGTSTVDKLQNRITGGKFASDIVATGLGFVPEFGWALSLEWTIFSKLGAEYGLIHR